jgi:DNA-directed RNA polymerase subunit L
MFGELMSNDNFKDKYITSLGSVYDFDYLNHLNRENIIKNMINIVGDRPKLLDFFSEYDFNNEYVFDVTELKDNKAHVFNIEAHRSTFVNIVTESLLNENHVIFFSEKTFKPMISAQPFIIVGNPYSIEKLKEHGFKTFDRWWDESYDLERNLSKRLEKIINVMEEISTWDYEKCYQVTQEMEDTLKHNFNVLLDLKNTKDLMNFLGTVNSPIIKRKLI